MNKKKYKGGFTPLNYSTLARSSLDLSTLSPLNSYWITGFADAETCFVVKINKHKNLKLGWQVRAYFGIELHKRDIYVLNKVQFFFGGVGKIDIVKTKDSVIYSVTSIEDLKKIIDHFDKYSLIAQKRADYELFKMAVEAMKQKNHLTLEGLHEIVSIRASMNKGLTAVLTEAFPTITPIDRPLVKGIEISDPNWLIGFAEG